MTSTQIYKLNGHKSLRRTRKLLKTNLSSENLIKGINTWTVLLVRYSELFLKWTREKTPTNRPEDNKIDHDTQCVLVWHANLIRYLISPNQDELFFQPGPFFTGNRKLGKLPNPLSLAGDAVQCRRHTGRSSITFSLAGQCRPVQTSRCGSRIAAAPAWTHQGTHLIYGFLARNPSWI